MLLNCCETLYLLVLETEAKEVHVIKQMLLEFFWNKTILFPAVLAGLNVLQKKVIFDVTVSANIHE